MSRMSFSLDFLLRKLLVPAITSDGQNVFVPFTTNPGICYRPRDCPTANRFPFSSVTTNKPTLCPQLQTASIFSVDMLTLVFATTVPFVFRTQPLLPINPHFLPVICFRQPHVYRCALIADRLHFFPGTTQYILSQCCDRQSVPVLDPNYRSTPVLARVMLRLEFATVVWLLFSTTTMDMFP